MSKNIDCESRPEFQTVESASKSRVVKLSSPSQIQILQPSSLSCDLILKL